MPTHSPTLSCKVADAEPSLVRYEGRVPILERIKSEPLAKALLALVLPAWICLPYLLLQHYTFRPVTVVPAVTLDHWIGFHPWTVWIYISLYSFMPLAPVFMRKREDLARYGIGLAVTSLLANVVFIFLPTTCGRPVGGDSSAMYRLLTQIDAPLHAFPSLHAGFAVFCGLAAEPVIRETRAPVFWRSVVWGWSLLIIYSALATKQHVFADIAAGSVLGAAVYAGVLLVPKRRH